MLGSVHCFLNIILRRHIEGKPIFFSPFCVFKAESSWEAGPLCCWAFSCLWQREKGLEQGEQRGAGGCRQRTPCTEPTSALLKHRSSGSGGPSPAPYPLPALSTHGCACAAHQVASSSRHFPASQTLHHVALSWKTLGRLTTSPGQGVGAK